MWREKNSGWVGEEQEGVNYIWVSDDLSIDFRTLTLSFFLERFVFESSISESKSKSDCEIRLCLEAVREPVKEVMEDCGDWRSLCRFALNATNDLSKVSFLTSCFSYCFSWLTWPDVFGMRYEIIHVTRKTKCWQHNQTFYTQQFHLKLKYNSRICEIFTS